MFGNLAKTLFGTTNEREVKRLDKPVAAINALEPDMRALSDDELRARTDAFRRRLAEGESLDDILVEAFAVVREAARRALGERPFDVQLMGAMVLHQGKIAEMKTGEGKTLVATMPAYLNALEGRGVHIVTVNDYLAQAGLRVDGGRVYSVARPRRPAASCTGSTMEEHRQEGGLPAPTSLTERTTSSASTICATT